MKKYLLVGGNVTSQNDGDTHYVPAHELARLYGVDIMDCVIDSGRYPYKQFGSHVNLKILKPRFDGDYTLGDKQ